MAKKNTLSILETIKSKITKFDQKTDKASRASDLDDEFEYVTSSKDSKKNEEVKTSEFDTVKEEANTADNSLGITKESSAESEIKNDQDSDQKITPKFEDDLGLGDLESKPADDNLENIPAKTDPDALTDENFSEGDGIDSSSLAADPLDDVQAIDPLETTSSLDGKTESVSSAADPFEILKGKKEGVVPSTQQDPVSQNVDDMDLTPTKTFSVEDYPPVSNSAPALESFDGDVNSVPLDADKNPFEQSLNDPLDVSATQEIASPQEEATQNIAPLKTGISSAKAKIESELEPFDMGEFSEEFSSSASLEPTNPTTTSAATDQDNVENPFQNDSQGGLEDIDLSGDFNSTPEPQDDNASLDSLGYIEENKSDEELNLDEKDPFAEDVSSLEEDLPRSDHDSLEDSLGNDSQEQEENSAEDKAKDAEAESVFSKGEIESYERNIDFDENTKIENMVSNIEDDNDFDIDSIGMSDSDDEEDFTLGGLDDLDDNVEENTIDTENNEESGEDQLDNLNLDDLDNNLTEDQLQQAESQEDSMSDEELLGLDDEELDPDVSEAEEIKSEDDVLEQEEKKSDDELDLDALDKELAEQESKPEEKKEEPKAEESEEKSDDELDLDALDKELAEQESKPEEKKEEPKAEESEEKSDDDLDLEELDKELEKAESQAKQEKETKEEYEEIKDEELDFDDLDEVIEESEDILEESDDILEESKPILEPKVKEQKNTVDDVDDLDLEELEKDAKEAEEKLDKLEEVTKKAIEKELSPEDEIDLEFEKEIMGFRPGEHKNEKKEKSKKVKEDEILTELGKIDPEKEVQEKEISTITVNKDDEDLFADEKIKEEKFGSDLAQELSPVKSKSEEQKIQVIQNKSSMLSDETVSQSQDSIRKLIDAKNVVAGISSFSKSPALAELAVEIMEPKLERWINEHLPEVVDNIVREEIKKIIPKD